jgi:hypothetical protein
MTPFVQSTLAKGSVLVCILISKRRYKHDWPRRTSFRLAIASVEAQQHKGSALGNQHYRGSAANSLTLHNIQIISSLNVSQYRLILHGCKVENDLF